MNRKYILIGTVAGLIITYLFGSMVVERRLGEAQAHLDERIIIQTELVRDTAELLGRGASNEIIAGVVPECSAVDGILYDELLASLDKGLTRTQLVELSDLFSICGDVAANRRAGMAVYLEQETILLSELYTIRTLLGGEEEADVSPDWQELVRLEKEISTGFKTLVEAQGRIIDLLLNNVAPSDIAVENVRASAQAVRERLAELTGAAATLRSSLLNS